MKRNQLLSLSFYEKLPFHGSENGTRYRVEKIESDGKKTFLVHVWPEPYGFEETGDCNKKNATFDFSENGINEVTDWINKNIKENL